MKLRALILIFLVGAFAALGQATTLVRLSLEQLAQASTEIARAHVVGQESQWSPEHRWIVTITTLVVDQSVKGLPPATLVIEQPGGTVGNIHLHVPGTVRFFPQAHYLLFLERSSADPARHLLVGMGQGAFRIYQDANSKEERVILPLGGVVSFSREPREGGVKPPFETLSLGDFRRQLTAALQAHMFIPPGTSIPVAILGTESRGVGRVRVSGRTTADIYPNSRAVVPAGSPVEGTARLTMGRWRIHWAEVSVRGVRVPISANSEEPAGAALRGRLLLLKVR